MDVYGAWRSREHFSVTGSAPIYTSVNVHLLAEAARAAVGSRRGPSPVLAELVGDGAWQLVYFAEPSQLRPITRAQGRKYEGVRAGTLRWSSTMRTVPPASETAVITRNLDTAN